MLTAQVVLIAVGLRDLLPLAGGTAVALVLWVFAAHLLGDADDRRSAQVQETPDEALQRWRARTEVMVSRADGTRGDWDRHLRPLLAREFQMTTGHRQHKDPKAMDDAGRLVFGDRLWPWVSPTAASFDDRDGPAPGGTALDEILTELERL